MITPLKERRDLGDEKKLVRAYQKLQKLIEELNKKEINSERSSSLSQEIEKVNMHRGADRELLKKVKRAYAKILNFARKELRLVPKNYYTGLWTSLGLSIWGLPIGMAISATLDNYGFIGLGLPFGLLIGMLVGQQADQKVKKEGRQLNIASEFA